MTVNVLFDCGSHTTSRTRMQSFDINETTTIQDLLIQKSDYDFADLSHYYPLSGMFAWGNEYLPYLFVNGKALFDLSFQDAKVIDFLNTHNITDNSIRIVIDAPYAGGFGGEELLDLWNNIYPVLENIAVLFTISGFNLKDLFHYLSKHFVKKQQPPQTCFEIVISRKQWSASELSSLLELSIDKTKELLKLCNYYYDRSKQQYVQGEHTNEIIEKLNNAWC